MDDKPLECWLCHEPILDERMKHLPHSGIAVHAECFVHDAVNDADEDSAA